ncbi:MAG: Clp protease N-terminal domain-containing protein [Propioniciclava sp.]|uniref:Clp protease N-terminal domain-containing protein n=1 Tax=Propioniciclava sp. TaxID=2038686 RepID=UPI0039E2532B
MSVKLPALWSHASSREAARLGCAEIDLPHLYLGLFLLGGSAARLLGRHGITLASARRRVRDVLAVGDTVDLPPLTIRELGEGTWPATPRAEELIAAASKAPDTFGLLIALLKEPSATVRRLVGTDGVLPQSLVPELRQGSDDLYSTERVAVDDRILAAPARAHRARIFVAAPPSLVAGVLSEPGTLALWAADPAKSELSDDGETIRHRRGDRTLTLRYHHKHERTGDIETVTWIAEMLDPPHAGQALLYDTFTCTPAPGGTELTRTAGRRRFGMAGRLLAPLWDSFANWGMVQGLPGLSFGIADRQPS